MTTTTHETHETQKTHETRATHARTWQDEYFTFVKRIEGPVLRTTTQLAARFAELVPSRPAFLAPLPKAHAVRDVMDTGFTFRKRMVEEQTLFARRMMKAIEPVLTTLDRVDAPPAAPAAPEQRTVRVRPDRPSMKESMKEPMKEPTKEPTKEPKRRSDRANEHPAA